jgi:hypothetical protein
MAEAAQDIIIHVNAPEETQDSAAPEQEQGDAGDTQQGSKPLGGAVIVLHIGMMEETPLGFVAAEAPRLLARFDETAEKTLDNIKPLLIEVLDVLHETHVGAVTKAIDLEREENGNKGQLDA